MAMFVHLTAEKTHMVRNPVGVRYASAEITALGAFAKNMNRKEAAGYWLLAMST